MGAWDWLRAAALGPETLPSFCCNSACTLAGIVVGAVWERCPTLHPTNSDPVAAKMLARSIHRRVTAHHLPSLRGPEGSIVSSLSEMPLLPSYVG